MEIKYNIIHKDEFKDLHRKIFKDMLTKQNRVNGDLSTKVDRCKMICIVTDNITPIAIGAIKEKTASDFTSNKANIPNRSNGFDWELGYLYTCTEYIGQGIASNMTQLLIEACPDINLMASTQIKDNLGMVKILSNNGFIQAGKFWKSTRDNSDLALFLKES